MKLYSWNVNGIRSVYRHDFEAWLTGSGADFVCLEEIKTQKEPVPQCLFGKPAYRFYANYAERPGYSGVAVYAKEEPRRVKTALGHARFDAEGRMLHLEYPVFDLIVLYIPHGGRGKENLAYKLDVYANLFSYLRRIKKSNIILAGDFNIAHEEIDLARPKENRNNTMFTPEERAQIDTLLKLGFVDAFRAFHNDGGQYTWWPYFANAHERNLGWRIDYIFVSSPLAPNINDAFIEKNTKGSDHCPIGIEFGI